MTRVFQIGAVLLVAAGSSLHGQQNAPQAPPPPRATLARPGLPKKGRGAKMAAGQRLINPASPAARLFRAAPEQRERALERLPLERQDQIRKQLQWFDGLPKEQQAIQLRRIEHFSNLPPEKKREVRQQMQKLNNLPPERRQAVRQALVLLQRLPDSARAARVSSDAFKNRFTPEEQRIILDLSAAWLPPM
jgi:hypothetical protein